jgi:SAM-dependent methyltransferase
VTDAAAWDRRYEATELVWSVEPNRFVVEVCEPLRPGVALDLAAGEGRNSIWLAGRGWEVTAVDFSAVALEKGRRLAEAQGEAVAHRLTWVTADLASYRPAPLGFDLVVLAYLQVEPEARRTVISAAAGAVAPGGTLMVVAHDRTNLADGTGGPQDPVVLYGPEDVTNDLGPSGLDVVRSGRVTREVTGQRRAIDLLVVARHHPDASG